MKNLRLLLATLAFLTISISTTFAQKPKVWTSGDIHEGIKKLNFLGSALYVAAHPDDENTRLISYLANEVKANTAYLSLTRGDGGQNLIGPEIRELLGVIRSQELITARQIDGGKQFFSRANDFGYSKHPDETLKIWNKKEVLGDVVWVIRKFQPDIIINRFDHDSAGETHGHHTSSAMLSVEAFDLANDKTAYPEQLQYVKPWQPTRLFFNTFWWFYGSEEAFAKADKTGWSMVDAGVFYPIKGESNTEIAAKSRSQHKSQGFGSEGSRGEQLDYLSPIKGDKPQDIANPFAGINTTWTRVEGGAPIGKLLAEVEKEFSYENPAASVPKLVQAYKLINALPEGYWKTVKLNDIKTLIEVASGLYLEAAAGEYSATPGQNVKLSIETVKRSKANVTLKSLTFLPAQKDTSLNLQLGNNKNYEIAATIQLPNDLNYTSPYWLTEEGTLGMYAVENQQMRGLPETPRAVKVQFNLEVEGEPISIIKDVVYKRSDPVEGEVYRPFEITPPVFANLASKVYVFGDDEPKSVQVVVKAGQANIAGTVRLDVPTGWKVEPATVDVNLRLKGEEQTVTFNLYPPQGQSEGNITAKVQVGGKTYDKELILLEYKHIPAQTVLLQSKAKVAKIDLKTEGERVAYIMGAGDEIPQSLQQIGYHVDMLDAKDINPSNLSRYDAIILGVRAYNTVERLKFHQADLLNYVKNGGTMIVQYNTNSRLVVPNEELAPYPLKLSRDRVTVEEAPVQLLAPDHPVLNQPNKITTKDFEGWVQERGLYFPNEWDEHFTPILSTNDPGEAPANGGLLVAKYGEGYYVYTGYAWFRQLPAGVPGAYRLFANIISLGNNDKPRP